MKRLSNPCTWRHHPALHPFSHMWPKIRKLVFVWSPSWLSNATQSRLLWWEGAHPQTEQKAAFFISWTDWAEKKPQSEGNIWHRSNEGQIFDFLEWKLAKQPCLKWYCKIICSESFGRADCKTLPHLGKVHPDEQHECLAGWEILHNIPTTAVTFLRKQYMVASTCCIASCYFVRTLLPSPSD